MTQYPPQPHMPPPAYGGPDDRPTSGMAIAACILGVLGVLTACVGIGILLGIIALILGIVAMGQTGDPPFPKKGKGLATTGLALGITSVIVGPIFALLIGILVPALGAARQTARQIQNSTQARGIQMGMVIYAQSNQTGYQDGWYPGIDAAGNVVDVSTENRFAVLLDANAFTPEYLLNPADHAKTEYTYSGNFTSDHYSYSLLDVSEQGARRHEWKETINTMAVVLTDRDASFGYGNPTSVWSDHQWRGTMVRNDNSTAFESSHIVWELQYGSAAAVSDDDIFQANGTDDALMVHEGD